MSYGYDKVLKAIIQSGKCKALVTGPMLDCNNETLRHFLDLYVLNWLVYFRCSHYLDNIVR